jgi:hypothetical protein
VSRYSEGIDLSKGKVAMGTSVHRDWSRSPTGVQCHKAKKQQLGLDGAFDAVLTGEMVVLPPDFAS